MNKKFSILKEVDLSILNNEIDKYMAKTGEMDLYIFMNINTLESIAREFTPSIYPRIHNKLEGYIAQYDGHKVYVNEDLDFGEVEIR